LISTDAAGPRAARKNGIIIFMDSGLAGEKGIAIACKSRHASASACRRLSATVAQKHGSSRHEREMKGAMIHVN
jgi:hypothetical protein